MRGVKALPFLFFALSITFGMRAYACDPGFVYKLEVNIDERTLSVMQCGTGSAPDQEISWYLVAVPDDAHKKILPLPLKGVLQDVMLRPWWIPEQEVRDEYLKEHHEELPRIVRFGSPLDAMGSVKFIIKFQKCESACCVRMHGTNRPDEIGKAVSHGCIRMYNEDALALAKIIEDHERETEIIIL